MQEIAFCSAFAVDSKSVLSLFREIWEIKTCTDEVPALIST